MKKTSVLTSLQKAGPQKRKQLKVKKDSIHSPTLLEFNNDIKYDTSYKLSALSEGPSPKIIYQIAQDDLLDVVKEMLSEYLPQIISELMRKEEDCMITASEAKDMLSVSSTTLWRMNKAGLIQSIGTGKNKRFKYKSILNYIKGEST